MRATTRNDQMSVQVSPSASASQLEQQVRDIRRIDTPRPYVRVLGFAGTSAIMVIAFGGFHRTDISIIGSMGFGLVFAVLIDATIVPGFPVPATMGLTGTWNWWAPGPARDVVDRLGFE